MFRTLIRVLFGFVIACLVAALAQVLFVITPDELLSLPAEAFANRMGQVGILTLLSATHFAIFAAPFALVAAALGEWWALRSWAFYVLVGLAIALAGFVAQLTSEVDGQATIVNNYALKAFLATGVAGGLAYWLFAGRGAGGPGATEAPARTRARPAANDDAGAKPTAKESTDGTQRVADGQASTGVPSIARKSLN